LYKLGVRVWPDL